MRERTRELNFVNLNWAEKLEWTNKCFFLKKNPTQTSQKIRFIVIKPDRAQQLNVQARSTSLLSSGLKFIELQKMLRTVS